MLVDMKAVLDWIVVSFASINLGHQFRGKGANDMLVDMNAVTQCMVVSSAFSARLPINSNAYRPLRGYRLKFKVICGG
jgi:hypothetical protein